MLAAINLVYLFIYFVWLSNRADAYKKSYKIDNQVYYRSEGYNGGWIKKISENEDFENVNDIEILKILNSYLQYESVRLRNKAGNALLFLFLINFFALSMQFDLSR